MSEVERGVPGALTERVVGWVLGAGDRRPGPRAACVLDPSAESLLRLRARVVAGVGGGDTKATFLDTVASAAPLTFTSKSTRARANDFPGAWLESALPTLGRGGECTLLSTSDDESGYTGATVNIGSKP